MRMTCAQCDGMLSSILERTRGICSSCHVLGRPPGRLRVSGRPGDSPPPQSGELAASDTAADRDSNDSKSAGSTGLSK
jgi:hypothetical protein